MATSKMGIVKDALILFIITLVSGICLGFVYELTKEPIELATIASNNKTYAEVLQAADTFTDAEGSADKIAELAASTTFSDLGYGSVEIESVLVGTDASGAQVGYVINSLSNNSYGGAVKISVGFDNDGVITGLGIRETSDTPGLGLKAKDAEFRDQYVGKNVEELTVTKMGASADNEIDAISGATITTNAVTNAVNAALYYLHNCME